MLYTDGLIERRDQSIEAGLTHLKDVLCRRRSLGPEGLADALLAELGVLGGARDDITLVVIRL